MKFNKKSKVSEEIPTASMPDIVFMLILFFMVTTVFRQDSGLPIDLPVAQRIKKLDAKNNVASIWANQEGEVSIDDKLLSGKRDITTVMRQKLNENSRIVASLKIDKSAQMRTVTEIHEALRDAEVLRVNYTAIFGD